MAQRVPAAGRLPASLAARERFLAAIERRSALAVGGIWALWAVAVLVLVAAATAAGTISDPNHSWPHVAGPLWPLFIWDYGWYHGIAITGYPLDQGGAQYAFFPLWPALLHLSGAIPDWLTAFVLALVASAAAFAGVGAAIPSGRRAQAAVALACWPGSFLLLLAYPDGIALAAAAWAAAFALRGKPWLAGVAGALAAVARPTGFLIAIPLLFVARGSWPGRVFAVAAPLAGAAAVHGYFWARSGDMFAFIDAESLPIWARNGPSRLSKWPGHVLDAIGNHLPLILVAVALTAAAVFVVARRFGRLPAAVLAYVCLAGVLLLGAQSPQSRIQSAILAVAVLALAVLVRLGPRYWPWALFSLAVLGISVFSGSVTSLGRQALFAFPLCWAVADGPRPLRHPLVAALAIAANVAYALTLAKYAP